MIIPLIVTTMILGDQGSSASDCRLIAADEARLACYDSVFGGPADVPGSRPTIPIEGDPRQSVPAVPSGSDQDFGLTPEQSRSKLADVPPPVLQINSRVSRIVEIQRDRFLLTLENGQIWLQIEPTPRQRFQAGDAITIRKAALNSYLASGERTGTGVRVRRID